MELETIMEEEKIVFSDLAELDLEKIFHFTVEMFTLCLSAFEKRDLTAARKVLEMEGTMDISKRKQGITTLSGSPPVTVTPGRQWSLTN